MAKITILPRKKFEISLDEGEIITGQYGTWAGMRFCRKRGVKLSEMSEHLNSAITQQEYEVVAEYILSAVEQVFDEKGGVGFKYNTANVFSWMDQIGWDKLGEILNPDEEKEKKSQEEKQSNGKISSELQEVAA